MDYDAYLITTREAARVTGGEFVSLAGGFFGLQLPADGHYVIAALDLDADEGWFVWREDADGERCCEDGTAHLGSVELDELPVRALDVLVRHRCR